MKINIKVIEGGKIPEYQTSGSAGADCYARLEKEIIIKSGKSETIPLGFAVEIPVGYEMQIRGRSGLARKNNIDGFLGTIDSDYRGEVCAILINKGQEDFIVKPFDRIAQAVIAPVVNAEWNKVNELSETERGVRGFGSTGICLNNPTESFYEPFMTFKEAEETLKKDVVIDGIKPAFVYAIVERTTVIGKKPHVIFRCADGDIEMDLPTAYMRVKKIVIGLGKNLMKTIDVRSLLGNPKEIQIPYEVEEIFNMWKKKYYKVSNDGISMLDAFYAGYIMANPIVRERFKDSETKLNI